MAEGAFRIGSVVCRSMSVLGKNIVPFGLLYLVINAPSALYGLTHPVAAGRDTTANMLAFAQTIVGIAATAAITYGTVNELRGRRLSFSEFVRGGLAQGGAAIRVAILSGIGTLLGLIALVIPGIFFYTIWWVAVPVAVIERPGAFASLKRSAALTRGFRWKLFGLIVAFIVAASVLAALSSAVIGVAIAVVDGAGTSFFHGMIFIEWVWTALFMAAQATLSAVIYYSLRVAKEGVEIGDIAAVFD